MFILPPALTAGHWAWRTLVALGLAAPPTLAAGQWSLNFDGTVPVTRQGNSLPLAWAGGLNFVQAGQVDLNGDGFKDLLLFDRGGNATITLLNNGIPNTTSYTVTRDYDLVDPLQTLKYWALMRDYDCDGREDLFTYSLAGFAVYRNTSSGGNLSFQMVSPQVRSDYVSPSGSITNANLYVSQVDLPGLADVDGDDDLDVLTFSLLGSFIEYHKNLSMEVHGTCDSLKYELRNKCWGFFSENFSTNAITLDVPCNFNVPAPEAPLAPEEREEVGGAPKAHAGSTITPLDLDGNEVMDLLLGDVSFTNLVGLYNGGTVQLAFMTQEDTLFPSYDLSVDLALFPGAFHLDLNNDGRRDLLVSPNATSEAQNFRSMWFYQNTGTDNSPVFAFQQDNLLQDRMLDFGEGAHPVPFDQDGDGLMDLLVSNYGYYNPGGTYLGRIALLRNTGTATAPAFELVTDDWMNLSTSGIGVNMHPAFGDIDGDGDLDLYIGDDQGRLHFYRNTATGPAASFQLVQVNVTDAAGATIDVGQAATPQFTDLDGDGLRDLIIGEANGNLNWYRNTGSAQSPAWTLMTEDLGGVSTVEWWNNIGHSVPWLFTAVSGEREIILGSLSGWLYHYGSIDGNIGGTWALLDSTFLDRRDGSSTAVCLHDWTGDGKPDMMVGNHRGGLSFWRSDNNTGLAAEVSLPSFGLQPNPANESVELSLTTVPAPGSVWSLRNSLGQVVMQLPARDPRTRVELHGLAAGLYTVRLEGPHTTAAQRLVVVR